jgi:hypothetical protein
MKKPILAGVTAIILTVGLRIALDAWGWLYHKKRIDILEAEILDRIADFIN